MRLVKERTLGGVVTRVAWTAAEEKVLREAARLADACRDLLADRWGDEARYDGFGLTCAHVSEGAGLVESTEVDYVAVDPLPIRVKVNASQSK